MLDTAVEAVKFFGGLGGIASSAFLIYDRIARFKPLAYLRPHDFSVELLINNVADESIIIDEFEVTPPVLAIKKTNDLMSTIEAVAARVYPDQAGEKARKVFVLIEPLKKRGFGLVRLKDFEAAAPDTVVTLRCAWRNTRKPIPFKRWLSVKATVRDLRLLKDAADAAGRPK